MIVVETLKEPAAPDRSAQRQALTNWEASLAAAPRLAEIALRTPRNLKWTFARDGALTALLDGPRWWAGCSVPRRAARFMFKSLDADGDTVCCLNPVHAVQIRVLLDMLAPRQAMIALMPDASVLWILLHCDDFSGDIAAGRLWIAAGEDWTADLKNMLHDNPGLATPSQFIRPVSAQSAATDALIAPAQAIFAEAGAERSNAIRELTAAWRRTASGIQHVCLIAPSRFHLWDDAGATLAGIDLQAAGLTVRTLDPDRPASASPLALAWASRDCDAILAPDFFRSSMPGVVASDLPWVTWVTKPAIPPVQTAGPNDRLLLADPRWRELAEQAGWTPARIEVARWPAPRRGPGDAVKAHPPFLAAVVNMQALDVPSRVADYSSHALLWKLIREELSDDPFACSDVQRYLADQRAKFKIGPEGFDASLFIRRLILPTFQQGVIRLLIHEKLPIRIFGADWESADEFADYSAGPISSRQELGEVIDKSTALLHLWPADEVHPIDTAGAPIVRAMGRRRSEFLADARAALKGPGPASVTTLGPVLSAQLVSNTFSALE